jgi:hypothetical protein
MTHLLGTRASAFTEIVIFLRGMETEIKRSNPYGLLMISPFRSRWMQPFPCSHQRKEYFHFDAPENGMKYNYFLETGQPKL